ncbi:ABC transporter permease [Cryobacterium arcticum]|uniref:ABC transporter permease n=2 Tax=Cryobacterium arcticum TaxID=670052 RepID=A0A318A1G2_9MICO|nr:ABC transporter permease [Cryobacterium arcticum]
MILGERATPASVAALRSQLGLDQPLLAQLGDFAVSVFTRGDTGTSLVYNVSTRELILQRAPVTLQLVALAVLFSVVIAVPLAVVAARQKDKLVDHLVRIIPTVGLGMPTFWVGLLLIILFAVTLKWFPVGGIGTTPWDPLRSLVLPALSVSLALTPPLVRSLRSELLEVFSADFVTTLRAARIPERRVLFEHILRNAALPTLTLLGVNVSYLIGGTLVVEQVFGINGLGSLLFSAISNRDFPVVQGVALFCALSVVVISLLLDAAVYRLDPRMRRS